MENLKQFVRNNDFFIVAHRGDSGMAPENTLAAFQRALDAGAKMIETDIQFTADDKVVIFHDATLERTTNGSGVLGEKKYDEIKGLDAGSWFSEEFSGEKIPLLSELIELIRGKAYLNIEIKSRKSSVIDHRLDKILNLIYELKFDDQVLLSSFDHGLIKTIKATHPELPVAAINIPGDKRMPSEICGETGAEAYVCSLLEINEEIADNAKQNGIYTGVYSFDNAGHVELAKKLGIKIMVTNFPSRIAEILGV